MSSRKIVYQNWIAEDGVGPARSRPYYMSSAEEEAAERNEAALRSVRAAVGVAVGSLDDQERFLIIRVHFLGQSIRQISAETNRSGHKLRALHRRAVKKLRRRLATFVQDRYEVSVEQHAGCIICRSPDRYDIDAMLRERDRSKSLKPVITRLRKHFSIIVSTPQIIIGHEKYH